jgi:hypothetical protein
VHGLWNPALGRAIGKRLRSVVSRIPLPVGAETAMTSVLHRFYDFFGAHRVPRRRARERERAFQRIVLPLVAFAILLILWPPVPQGLFALMGLYAIAGAAFYFALPLRPDGFVAKPTNRNVGCPDHRPDCMQPWARRADCASS